MFYLVFGKSRQKASDKGYSLARGLLAKKPEASYVKIEEENWSEDILREVSGTQGLFESKHVILCDELWSSGLATADDIETIKDSENIFILIETSLPSVMARNLSKNAAGVTEVAGDVEEERFNVFTLSDALGEKDKKKLWVLYRQALANNIEPEEVHGILFWQIKNLILAKEGLLNGKLKVSPFVASKAKKYSAHWSKEELESKAKEMVDIYHKSRMGQLDFETSLERLILKI